ncbi:MAG: ABC transporter substrate-binding protein [Pseudomonadota bacterium]
MTTILSKENATTSLIAIACAVAITTPAVSAELGAVDKPIKLAINEWTGQHVSTHVAGSMLKAAGYEVEYVTAGYYNMYQAIADGEIHGAMEIWSSNAPEDYTNRVADGSVHQIGDLQLEAREGLAYPAHVAEICPGLPAWEALVECSSKFATADTLPSGRLVDYPADWGTPGADRVTGLDLPFKAVPAGSEGAMIAEIRASTERKTPLLVTFWQPHWAMSAYDLKFVELPEAEAACFDDASWGTNPDATSDCDFLPAQIFKASWPGFEEAWPAAYEILEAMTMDVNDQQAMMALIDVEGGSVEDVVADWLAENEAKWRTVVDAALN